MDVPLRGFHFSSKLKISFSSSLMVRYKCSQLKTPLCTVRPPAPHTWRIPADARPVAQSNNPYRQLHASWSEHIHLS